jgi:hypothetical protein
VQLLRAEHLQVDSDVFTTVDRVRYDTTVPWPTDESGVDKSIQRAGAAYFGSFGSSWRSDTANPGKFVQATSDQVIDAGDVDLLCRALRSGQYDSFYDLDGDLQLTERDLDVLVKSILLSGPGDANLDGRFTSSDLVLILSAGGYEDSIVGNSVWSEGDWDGDGEFSTHDLVLAFQWATYESV